MRLNCLELMFHDPNNRLTVIHPYIITDDQILGGEPITHSKVRVRQFGRLLRFGAWAHTPKIFQTIFHICLWDRFLMP